MWTTACTDSDSKTTVPVMRGRVLRNLLVATRHDPAVHVPDGAGDPARLLRQQKVDHGGHIVHAAHTTDGMKAVETG